MGEIKGWMSHKTDVPDGFARPLQPARLETARPPASAGLDKSIPAASTAPAALRLQWPTDRVAAVQALWGQGFTTPGGAPETLLLAKPLRLSDQVGLLLLGGGLGGAASTLSEASGCTVTNLEADDALRTQAAAHTCAQPRITVGKWDRTQPAFPPRSTDRVLSLEALRGSAAAPLLEGLAAALQPGGQLVLTELVAETPPEPKDREFAAWCRLENRLPALPQPHDVGDCLQLLGLHVQQQEDISDRHIGQTLEGWRQAVEAIQAAPRPSNHTAAAFVAEAELWLLRIRLMRRLGMRLMRWHAVAA